MLNKNLVLITIFVSAIIAGISLHTYFKQRSIKSDNTILIVGTNAEFPPFEYIENDKLVGFDIDLLQEIAKRMGKRLEIKDMPFSTLISQLQMGGIHLIAAGLTPTKERAEHVLFSHNYLAGEPLIIVSLATKTPLKNIDDLKTKEIIVNDGFTADLYLSTLPEITLKRLPSVADAFLALTSGRGDAFVTAHNTVKPFFDQYGSEKFMISPIEGTNEPAAFAISKQHPELVEQINKVLEEMQEDGSLEAFKRKWHLP